MALGKLTPLRDRVAESGWEGRFIFRLHSNVGLPPVLTNSHPFQKNRPADHPVSNPTAHPPEVLTGPCDEEVTQGRGRRKV